MKFKHNILSNVYYPYKAIKNIASLFYPNINKNLRVLLFHDIPEKDFEIFKDKLEWLSKEWNFISTSDFEKMGASHERVDTSRHPAMHKTKTIDYIILLKGDVTLLVDKDEVRLKPFDVVVQRGTNHAWVNNGSEPAILIAVLIDSELKE